MSSEHAFESQLALAWPASAWHGFRLILAVSGGADSVALLRAIHRLRGPEPGRLLVAHFNHRLRGADSEEDARFAATLAQSLDVESVIGSAQAGVLGSGGEAEARSARYAFLEATARRFGARYVVTAHTADDQAETVLHHILRGTGLAGLAGMPRVRTLGDGLALVRPLLGLSRADVLCYLTAIGQSYREDATNRDVRFTRNRVRHELLPLLKRDYAPSVVESLLRLSSLAADAQRVIGAQVEMLTVQCVVNANEGSVTLDANLLAGKDPHLVREFFASLWRKQHWPLQEMTHAHWTALAELARTDVLPRDAAATRPTSSPTHLTLPGAIRAQRQAERIVLTSPDAGSALVAEGDQA
jgi:tRNA(Ile)-lysidine synthase